MSHLAILAINDIVVMELLVAVMLSDKIVDVPEDCLASKGKKLTAVMLK